MPTDPKYPTLTPNVGRFSSRIVELGNTAQSQALANEGIISQNNAAFVAQQKQQQEAARLKAANDAKIDKALEAAAQVNLESVGALRPSKFFPPASAVGTMGPQLTTEYQLINQEKNRSKQILQESFAQKDPISEELNRKMGQIEDELDSVIFSKQSGSPITTGEGGGGAGLFLQDFIKEQALGKDVSIEKEKELRATLANLSQAQVSINKFKTDIQLAKATEDYLLNLKGKGQKIDQSTIKGLVDISKDIVAKQRAATRGDELYNPDTYETYMTQIKGNNDFFDWRHTDISIGSALEAVNNRIKEDPSKAKELIPVLDELQNVYKQHEKTNKDAYDNYYGAQKRYLKEGMFGSTYLKSQVIGSAGEGFYNFASPFVTTSLDLLGLRKTAFEARQAKDKTYSGAVLYADLNKDQQLDERDWDIHKNYQRVGQDVTYIKQDGTRGYLAESVLGASVRTLAEMVPTLIATRRLMGVGLGARAATFLPVSISSGVRSFEENKKWYKDKGDAAIVGAVQGIIEGATESIVPDINYFLGNKKLATKALGAGEKKYFIAQTLVPEFTTLSAAVKNFLTSSAYAGKAIASQSLQEGFEEEISMFANYFLDKVYKTKDDQFGEKPQELDDSSILGFGNSMITTFINSAASGLLMSGASIAASRNQDRNYMRFNIANNPELFKQELTKQLQNNQITQDQYNRGILETGRLTQLKERANSTMMNLVDGATLLEDKDQQYDYFSRLLTRDDLLQKVDYTAMSDEDKVEYAKQVEKVEKEINGYENLAKQYAEMPQEKKEEVLAKMVQRQLDTVQSTSSPAVLAKNLEDIDDAIQVGEKTGKGSPIMVSGRQQVREAVIARMEQLNSIQENGNTAFENQLLDTPVESMGESMQVSNVVRLEKLLLENNQMISPQVKQELLSRIAKASTAAQEQLKSLPKKEQKRVIARELARVELLHPGTAFSDERLKKLFAIEFTPEEKSELIRETAVTIAREKEKIKEEDILQPTEKDTVIDSLIKSFESQPLEVQLENKEGNLERVRNEERTTREMRAIFAIPRSKSKEQAKNRVKSIFKAMGYSTEDVNKALEDLNNVFDNQEVTNPGDIYSSYLKFLNPTLLKGLPDKVAPQEDILEEEPVIAETVTEVPTPSEISDQEYNNFIDNGVVSKERINSIANKIKNNEQLSPREKEIFTDKTAEINAELVDLAKTSTTLEEDELFGTNEEIDAAREKKLEIPQIDPADEVVEVTVEAPVIEDEFDGLEVVPVSTIESSDLVATTPTVFTSSNSGVQGSIMKTLSNSVESFNLKLMDMFSFIRETLGESSMSTLESIYNNVTEALKTNDTEALARLKEDYLAVFSGSTFSNEQLDYIWNEQYVKGKPDSSIPFQEAAYVTNPQFALAYQGEPVLVTGVNKQTGEMFTYKATITGNVNEANQIEVKTAKGALVYIKKSNLQTTTVKPVNVRANFNQTNSVMITAVDRTTGEIVKFNSNGERDAQGDTQLNVFAPRENDTMKEVRKSLASGQPISHTLPIHAGARINNSAAYKKGKNSVYLTASVAGIDTSIQTVEPEIEIPAQPIDAKEQAPSAETIQETESKIKQRDLFDGVGAFSRELGGSREDAVPVSHSENNGIEFVQYANPKTGSIDVIVTGTSENDFVGFYRIYENGKPTNRWSSKFENQSRNKENFKSMISGIQAMLPEGHEYTEKTSISTDGLRVWDQQLNRGYELQYDNNGKLITNLVAINGDAIENELGVPVEKGNFENVKIKTQEQFNIAKKAILPYLEKFGLNESNIYWYSGTIKIDLPVLRKSSQKVPVSNVERIKVSTQLTDARTDIERRRQEEINKPLEAVKNAKTKEDLIKASEEWIGVNPYDDGAVSMGVRSLLMTPGSFEKGKQAFIEENKKIAEIRNKQINAKYDAELAALRQPTEDTTISSAKEYVKEVFTQTRKAGRSGYMKRVREKLTQVKDSTLSVGKKYARVVTDEEANVTKVEIVTGTGKSFKYTFMSGYTGSGTTKSTETNFPTFIDENGKESGVMTPERLGYFFELPKDQPTTLEPEVTTNLSKDELAILSFDVSSIEGIEGSTEVLDQNTGKEIDNAGSCKIN